METNHLDKQNFFDLGNLNALRKGPKQWRRV